MHIKFSVSMSRLTFSATDRIYNATQNPLISLIISFYYRNNIYANQPRITMRISETEKCCVNVSCTRSQTHVHLHRFCIVCNKKSKLEVLDAITQFHFLQTMLAFCNSSRATHEHTNLKWSTSSYTLDQR